MALPNILEFDVLLAPIPGDNPAGADLRLDPNPASDYYKLKDARFAARAKEREVDAGAEVGNLPEWRTILDLAPKVLAEQSKDLEVAAWLVEALLRRHNFAGLRDGFRLVRSLVETYWDGLYPLPDEDGVAAKVAPLTALNGEGGDGTLIQPIRKVWLTDGHEPGPFAAWHYEQAQKLATITDESARAWHTEAGTATNDQIEASRRATKPQFFLDLVDDLRQCQEEFSALTAAVDKAAGRDSPPTSTIRNTLESTMTIATTLGRDALAAAQTAAAAEAAGEAAGDGAAAGASGTSPGGAGVALGSIRSREEAFKALLQVGDYFRRNEPQSLVPYVLEELVRRGRMPLPDLLSELIQDTTQLKTFYTIAGMRPPPEQQQ
ncbi:MAG: type VI secretion system protein TssA [Dongiaceae bacterium]